MVTCGQNSVIRKNASTVIQKSTCPKQISILGVHLKYLILRDLYTRFKKTRQNLLLTDGPTGFEDVLRRERNIF